MKRIVIFIFFFSLIQVTQADEEYLRVFSPMGLPAPLLTTEDISHLNSYAGFHIATGYELNPNWTASSFNIPDSLNVMLAAGGGLQQKHAWGNFAENYFVRQSFYFNDSSADLQIHEIDFPITMTAGEEESIQIRPFGSYMNYGHSPLYGLLGISVLGVSKGKHQSQSVQGSLYADRYLERITPAQQGFHYRFEYDWAIFPTEVWMLHLIFFLEHIQAGRDVDTSTGKSLPYSHTDVGLSGLIEVYWGKVKLGAELKLLLREDVQSSVYPISEPSTPTLRSRREEFTFFLNPTAKLPIDSRFALTSSLLVARRFSSMGSGDFIDRNYFNFGASVGLQGLFGNL
jgi:hypothetical protein